MTDKILSEFFTAYGFCPFEKISDNLLQCRAISRLPENPQTVICCLFPYYLGENAYSGSDISKYAVVPDYHGIIGNVLSEACQRLKAEFPDEEFVPFTDNSPIPEVRACVYAGLGVRGKNGLLINKTFGSWVFIGEIVTTKKYDCQSDTFWECIKCGKCVASCPTGSITENGINRTACLSDITQRKGELDEKEKKLIIKTKCVWGCDICQNVCPMNADVQIKPLAPFVCGAKLKADAENSDGRAYAWRGKKVIERNLEILYKKEG